MAATNIPVRIEITRDDDSFTVLVEVEAVREGTTIDAGEPDDVGMDEGGRGFELTEAERADAHAKAAKAIAGWRVGMVAP